MRQLVGGPNESVSGLICSDTMLLKTRFRLTELLIAVAMVGAALIWAERVAWRQIRSLRAEMTVQHIGHFRSADELRAAILHLQDSWRRGIGGTNGNDKTRVESEGRRVRELIADWTKETSSSTELELAAEITAAFDRYLSLILESLNNARKANASVSSPAMRQGVGTSLERLLALMEKLTLANRTAAEDFIRDNNAALTRLQRFLLASLLGLSVCGAAVVVLLYRRMIAPLRTNLSESRAIIERQEKLASLGVFAAGIAHEIRNPLTAIKVRLFTLKSSHKPDTSEHEDLEVIDNEIDRLERIVRDFLQFARPTEPDLKIMPVDKLLQEVHNLLHSDIASKSVELKLEPNVGVLVLVDPDKMKQVLINFVQNGAQSIEGAGMVTLRSRVEKHVLSGRNVSAVVIDVADTGKGIPPEVQKRLFDPFFTTKEAGTGLGLPIAARIVEKHGGVIQVQTQANRGTTFSIVLPIALTNEIQS